MKNNGYEVLNTLLADTGDKQLLLPLLLFLSVLLFIMVAQRSLKGLI